MGCCCGGASASGGSSSSSSSDELDRRVVRLTLEPLDNDTESADDEIELAEIRFDQQASESDSVDDEEYYATYTTRNLQSTTQPLRSPQQSRIANRILCVMLRGARLEANRCVNERTAENLVSIAQMYDAAIIAALDPHVKRKIIREFELLRQRFPSQRGESQLLQELLSEARSLEEPVVVRQAAYRRAIRLVAQPGMKTCLKHEYNEYIILTRVKTNAVI